VRLVTGCDVVDVARLAGAIARRPGLRDRVFTPHELTDVHRGGVAPDSEVAHARLAARFAAKEATRKALRDLRLPFHAVEVRCADDGAPELFLHGRPAPLACSLSHDGGVAMAVVVGPAPDRADTAGEPRPTDAAGEPRPTDDPDPA
jgi:holo-[acyl-carrier protein] synthase